MRAKKAIAGLFLLLGVAGCRDATQISLLITTNARCSDIGTTTVTTGAVGSLEDKPPGTARSGCTEDNAGVKGIIGTVVIAPSGANDDEVAFRVVTGVRRSAETCTAPSYAGCIVARRALRYVPHTSTAVNVEMDLECLDVPCGALDTCFHGKCVPISCAGNPDACDAGVPSTEGGAPDAAVAETGVGACSPCGGTRTCVSGACVCPTTACSLGSPACASSTSTAPCVDDGAGCGVTGTPPASCASLLQTCASGVCACPTGGCTLSNRRCNVGADHVEVCEFDVTAGCPVFTASGAAADACGTHQVCVTSGNNNATCTCVATACAGVGAGCLGAAAQGTCALDTNGCLYVTSSMVCVGPQTCQVARCGCDTRADCLATSECSASLRTCVADTAAPTISSASLVAPTIVRVRFSEPVNAAAAGPGAMNPANYCFKVHNGDYSSCTQTADFGIQSIAVVDSQTFDVTSTTSLPAKTYSVFLSNVVDGSGNVVGSPRYADFIVTDPLRVLSATMIAPSMLSVVFSKPVTGVPNGASSAACTTAAECAKRYLLVGPAPALTVSAATVQTAPKVDTVVLTLSGPPGGGIYAILAANGINGDGFDDLAFGPIKDAGGVSSLQTAPRDRALFLGLGAPIAAFGDGPLLANAFADGTAFSYAFSYRGRVYLGPARDGRSAVRFLPDGSQPEIATFSINKDTNGAGGSMSNNNAAGPFPSIGSAGCVANTLSCGPDNENGRGLFTSGMISGAEWLVMGGGASGGNLRHIYVTQDDDAALTMKYVDLGGIGGEGKGFSSLGNLNGRIYATLPATGGNRPFLEVVLKTPSAASAGLDAVQNSGGGNACVFAVDDACDLQGKNLPSVGGNNMIDFISSFNGLLYLGNAGGLVRSTTATPNRHGTSPGDWAGVTPTAAAYTGKISATTTKTAAIDPVDKAWPQMALFGGRVYLGRNTTTGPQIWRCDPATISGPTPATATACDPGDWSLVAANSTGDALLSQFNNPNNTAITLIVASGAYLYVGYDNTIDGLVIYRTQSANPLVRADFTGLAACSAATPGCAGLGQNGFGLAATNRRIFDAISVPGAGGNYLYVTVGNGAGAVSVYRNLN